MINHGFNQGYYTVEINHVDATKGKGIKRVIEQLNMSIEDTICFGDGMNDYDMMKLNNMHQPYAKVLMMKVYIMN